MRVKSGLIRGMVFGQRGFCKIRTTVSYMFKKEQPLYIECYFFSMMKYHLNIKL